MGTTEAILDTEDTVVMATDIAVILVLTVILAIVGLTVVTLAG